MAGRLLLDRYEIQKTIGVGGAGELLLVRDRHRDGLPLALKVLRPRVRDPGLEPLFRREFLLLSNLRHENIVAVRDFGFLPTGEPFFTMDYVEGEDGRACVREEKLKEAEILALAEGSLRALAHVHARGMLHGDLKPANILLRPVDGRLRPVLVDFGLARAFARPGEASGTLPYIAPEAIAGAAPDARADLFALGVTLYEVCTGRAVGEREETLRSPSQVFAPERIRRNFRHWARDSTPRRFDEFVARLCAASPAARYPSAAAALEALGALYGKRVGGEKAEEAPEVVGELPLVGRGSALEMLLTRVRALLDGELLDPILVVAGRAGYGTSRLLASLRNHAAALGLHVAFGRNLRELEAEVAYLGGRGEPPSAGDARALVFLLDTNAQQVATRRPLLLIVDDVDRLDTESATALRDWIAAVEGRKGPARFAIAIGGRQDAEGPGGDLLRTAGASVPLELRELPPLQPDDVRSALVLSMGDVRPPPPFVQAVHRATGGSPRLLAEIVRILHVSGVLGRENGRPVIRAELLRDLRLPKGVDEAAQIRAESLPPEARTALERIALAEGPLPDPAARVLAGAALDRLVSEGFLVRDRGNLRFPDDLARRGCDSLRGKARIEALRISGEAIRATGPAAAAQMLADAGELASARPVGLEAARALAAGGRGEEAVRLLSKLRGEPPDLEVTRALVSLLRARGRSREGAAIGLPLAERPDADVDFVLSVANCLGAANQGDRVFDLLRRTEPRARGSEVARVVNARAAALRLLGRGPEALAESDRALAACGGRIDALEGRIGSVRAQILLSLGRRAAALRVQTQMIESPQIDWPSRVALTAARGSLHRAGGRWRRAIRDYRACLRIGDREGVRSGSAMGRYRLAAEMLDLGRPQRAVPLYEEARRAYEEMGSEGDAGLCLVGEALALLELARPAEAETRLARAESLPSLRTDPDLLCYAKEARARILALAGDYDAALSLLDAAAAPELARGRMAPEIALATGETRLLAGRYEEARDAFRRAARLAFRQRARDLVPAIRTGLAECAGHAGAWNVADLLVERGGRARFGRSAPAASRALVVRAGAAMHRREFATAGRHLEEAVRAVNRGPSAPARAAVYESVAFLLEEGEMQRHLRRPTGPMAAMLLDAARDIWTVYGNDAMLRKIDLHLAELPRVATGTAPPEVDRLVKILHITREMNREFDRDRLLGIILDRAIELTGAERGFVILLKDGKEEVHIARNLDHESLNAPEEKLSSQIVRDVVRSGRIVVSADAAADHRFEESVSVRNLRLRSIVAVPFRSGGRTIGALYLDNRFKAGSFAEHDERLLELFADQAVTAIEKAEMIRELESRKNEIEALFRQERQRSKSQGRELEHARLEIRAHRKARGWGFDRIAARSVSMQGLVREAKKVAGSEIPVLLLGENGTGKEVLARAIHVASPRQAGAFVPLNCGAVAESLLEAELFGHVRGSFTGAERDRAGVLEEANGGTLFLDEIGEMPLSMQVKLLRALESGEVRRVGDSAPRTVDVRIVSATNADLAERVRSGAFREDLYYRLCGVALRIPPLRQRLEDIEPLACAFVEEAAGREGKVGLRLSSPAIARLESYTWPGNVRELRNVLLRAVVNCGGDTVEADHIVFDAQASHALPGFDPSRADRVVAELIGRGQELNDRQQAALSRVLTRGQLGFSEYQRLFKTSKSTVARDLDALVSGQLLERRGKTRAAIYLPGPKLRDFASRAGAIGK